ncbi:MAG: preprotein translocase subunit YajC [Christensenellaceae bacterium]|jgi:preprotein translocase YajC subunit|nr:preprotein translocase subunit YajC [Christensenellaceae bacterium]
MTNLLLKMKSGDIGFYVVLAVIILVFTVLVASQSRRRKTQQAEYTGMLDTLRVGTKVKTVGGVIGVIKEIREEAPGFKTVLLETPSLIRYDLQAIYGIVNEEKIAQAQATNVQEHKDTDSGIDNTKDAFEAKKTKPKSGTTKKN